MSSTLTDLSQRRAAVIAGLAFVAMIVLAFFANFFVLDRLVEPGDAAATASNIASSAGLFRAGIAAFAAVFALDVVMAWALYAFFKRANRGLSLLAAWFRLMTAAISATALLNLLVAVRLVDGTGYSGALEAGQRDAQVMLSLDAYHYGWDIGLVFFGVYLLLLGFMAVRSDYVPSILGVLVALAGLGYVVNDLARVLLTGYEADEAVRSPLFLVLAVAGEFSLGGWLLLRGGRKEAREAASVPA
jgi:Domain of unknown function (DUF4386)